MPMKIVCIFPEAVQYIFTIFKREGFDIRLVGGCVRDTIMDNKVHDYDFATNATPKEIMRVLDINEIAHIEPGFSHGTISAIINRTVYEITTLRIDTNTDGRHAEVQFTQNWMADASRRDFTINAMYIDSEKILHDYFGGYKHIWSKEIHFVGDARERIKEDYLRILRMFRFGAKTNFSFTNEDLKVVKNEVENIIKNVSVERIFSELDKTFNCIVSRENEPVIVKMIMCNVFSSLGFEFDINRFWRNFESRNVTSTFFWFCMTRSKEDIDRLVTFFKMPTSLKQKLYAFDRMRNVPYTEGFIWHLQNIEKIPVPIIAEFFDMNENSSMFKEIKVDTAKLMNQGFSGKALGDEITRITKQIIEKKMFEDE